MVRKIAIAIVVLGLAAFSPAPINKARGPRTFHPEMTQEQVAKQQGFNGVTPVVGQVPQVLNEVGMALPPKGSVASDHNGEKSIAIGTANADKVRGSIKQASTRITVDEEGSSTAWYVGLLIAVLGYAGWKIFQLRIEKTTPVPNFSKRFLKDFENGKI